MMSTSTTSLASKISVILKSPTDWGEWILVVNSIAETAHLEAYIDLIAAAPAEPIKPIRPSVASVKAGAVQITELSTDERLVYNLLWDQYKVDLKKYEKDSDGLKILNTHIFITIDRSHLFSLTDKKTVHSKFTTLKQRLAFTDRVKSLEVIRRYRELQKTPKHQSLAQWVLDWEATYDEEVRLKIPDVQGTFPLYDFLNALRPVDMAFVAGREAIIEDRLERDQSPPDMKTLIENFRNHCRTMNVLTGKPVAATNSAFATLQGQPPTQGNKPAEGKRNKTCLCGEKHYFFQCPYIVHALRKPDWAPDSAVEKVIADKIAANPKFKQIIKEVFQRKKVKELEGKAPTSPSTPSKIGSALVGVFAVSIFSVSQQLYKLVNNWIIDGGSDTHLCNDPTRFRMERSADQNDLIITGKTVHKIEAWGSVNITAQSPAGPILITLVNVALMTGYFTNLVCLDRFEEKGVWYDVQQARLHRDGQTFCYISKVGRHRVIEYNALFEPINLAAFAASTGPLSINEAIGAEWHAMLGHPGPETIQHLEKAVEDVRIVKSETASVTKECETCVLIKAH